ncbi:MAG: M1 family metallopeptidase [Novosphingobium sp.]
MRRAMLAISALTVVMAAATPALGQKIQPQKVGQTSLHGRIPIDPVRLPPPPPPPLPPTPLGKLGSAVTPSAYRLDVTLDPAKDLFTGHAEIDAALAEPSAHVFLHGNGLNVSLATATAAGKVVTGTWKQLDEETGVAALTFDEPLPAGRVTFRLDYDGVFNKGPVGLFHVKVGDDWYAWSQFESIDARSAFPSFDEPGFKTPYTVTLRTPPGLTAVSNAPELAKTQEAGLDVHRFAPTLPLPSYLVAMMVGPFAVVEGAVPPNAQRGEALPLRIISPKPNADRLSFALENSKTIVALLEDYFGQPFPYPKLDQITSPIMPGAMENAGADNYADNLIVMGEDAPVPQKRKFGMVVAHELAHQWFGDLVTPAWWDDIWLNESFANWMGYRIGNAWRPDLHIGSGATAEGFAAMNTDALVAGRPIHQAITASNQIDAAFDTITYGKGGHVVAMIAAFMGDHKFKDGVRRYMAAHRYGNASSADFFSAMAEVAGDPRILPAMQSFTDQQGVPLITFTRDAGGGYIAAQSRYVRLGTTAPDTRWGVPLCLRKGAVRQCQLLDGPAAAVTINGPGVLMPNENGSGYYRFELPRKDWDALIASADRLSGNEALAVSDSLMASYQAGRANTLQLAALARKLARNPDSHAAGAALNGLEMLRSAGLMDDAANTAYRRFVARLYAPAFGSAGLDLRAGAYAADDAETLQRRVDAIGALAGIAKAGDLQAKLADAAGAFLGGDKAALDPMWFDDAFGAWLDREGLAGGQKMLDAALASQDPVLRPTLLATLGSSGKVGIATWLLSEGPDPKRTEEQAKSANAGLRLSERLGLVRDITASGPTRDLGYAWVQAHLEDLMGGAGGIFFASRLPQMLGSFCSVERADEFATALRPRFAGKTGALELDRVIEKVRDCAVLQTARKAEASAELARLR